MWTNTTYNSIATYSCDTGHMLVGDETRTCLESGVWSGSTPICTGECTCRKRVAIVMAAEAFEFPLFLNLCF